MEATHQMIRLNYVRLSQILQAEVIVLSEFSELVDDERCKQSLVEVIYHFNNLSDSVNLQRRYLNPRA